LLFDDIAIAEVKPVYARQGNIELGAGEKVKDNVYIATRTRMGVGGPDTRFLFIGSGQQWGFRGGRWYVNPRGVFFRHKVGEIEQTEAWLKFHVGWNPRGRVIALVSNDGKNFEQVYETRKLYWTDTITLPAKLFPAKEIYIWFRCVETREDKGKRGEVTFELTGYEYKAKLAKPVPDLEGRTEFVEVTK